MEGSGVLCGDMIVVVKNCTWKDGKMERWKEIGEIKT